MSISVIIPAYNSMAYLKETLDSVLAQTLPADEILVVDDGSTDGTAAFAESYGPPIRVFRCANQRQALGRNYGVEQASSEWVAFLDHDDLWTSEKLERQMSILAHNPEADLCYTGCRFLILGRDGFEPGRTFTMPLPEDLPAWLLRDVVFLPSCVVVRRTTFLAAGGFDPSFRFVEDWDLWLRLLHAGSRFVAVPESLVFYRIHDANASAKAAGQLQEIARVYRRHIAPRRRAWYNRAAWGRFISGFEAEGAYNLRRTGSPGYLAMMLRSIFHWPLGGARRYKVAAHMLYTKLRGSGTLNLSESTK